MFETFVEVKIMAAQKIQTGRLASESNIRSLSAEGTWKNVEVEHMADVPGSVTMVDLNYIQIMKT